MIVIVGALLVSCNQERSHPDIGTLQKNYQEKLAQQGMGQLPDSAIYEGEFKDGLFHGTGTLRWRNGVIYSGEFQQGMMHGKGKIISPEVFEYEGEFAAGLWDGQGKVSYTAGDSYRGQFRLGQFEGQGLFITFDGSRYEGQFQTGHLNGKGKIVYAHGGVYEGDVVKWRMNGSGTFTMNNTVYSGEFVNDIQQGIGSIKYESGDFYQGEIKNWLPQGKGEYHYRNGDRYKGEFANGVAQGHGTLSYKNGDVYEGEFREGSRHGTGAFTNVNIEGEKNTQAGWWEYNEFVGEKPKDTSEQGIIARMMQRLQRFTQTPIDAEKIFYSQPILLEKTLNGIAVSDPDKIDLYFVGFAAYGSQDVFMKETRYARELFDERYSTAGRSVLLINNHDITSDVPLASSTNLDLLLKDIGNKMDKDNDILFLYLTSHGSRKKGLDVSLRGLPLNDLSPETLDMLLDASGIKWKVIVISACYSGEFIDKLKDDYTLIMTSSRKDRKSFGCSDEAEFTYFGRALFKHGIPQTTSFTDAFVKADEMVRQWEAKEKYKHSEPQMWHSEQVLSHLQAWQDTLNTPARVARNK